MSIVDDAELVNWRLLEVPIRQAVETLLALNGESATPELRQLQSDLVEIEIERKALGGGS